MLYSLGHHHQAAIIVALLHCSHGEGGCNQCWLRWMNLCAGGCSLEIDRPALCARCSGGSASIESERSRRMEGGIGGGRNGGFGNVATPPRTIKHPGHNLQILPGVAIFPAAQQLAHRRRVAAVPVGLLQRQPSAGTPGGLAGSQSHLGGYKRRCTAGCAVRHRAGLLELPAHPTL